jgi:large subunit ribosomal protein L29
MKAKELRQKQDAELLKLLSDLRKKFEEEYLNFVQGKLKNVKILRSIKKDIARILTILNERKKEKINIGAQKQT